MNLVFPGQTPESLAELGFRARGSHVHAIGSPARNGLVFCPAYQGDDVQLIAGGVFRSRDRAEHFAQAGGDGAVEPTGRAFVVERQHGGRPVHVVYFERYV